MQRLAIWDLDGTLVDSSLDLCASGNHVRQTMSLEPLSVPAVKAMIGDGLTALLQRMLPEGTDIDWAKSIFADHYDEQCVKNTPLYEGMASVLAQLHAQGWMSALVSNKPDRWCGPILKANNIDHYFSTIRGGDGIRKPQPDPLLDVCRECEVDISCAVMIGDLSNDILAANNAGCSSIHVRWGFGPLPDGLTASRDCEHYTHLVDILNDVIRCP